MSINTFINSLKTVKAEWDPYYKWDKEHDDREAQRKALYGKVTVPERDLVRAKNFGRTFDNIVETIDENTENTRNNINTLINPISLLSTLGAITVGSASFINNVGEWRTKKHELLGKLDLVNKEEELKKLDARYIRKLTSRLVAIPFGIMAVGLAFSLLGGKLQLMGSKIARYQTYEDLNDPTSFVQYDNDQLENAKELIRDGKIPKESKNTKSKEGFWANLVSLIHDYKDTQIWEAKQDRENFTIAKPNPTKGELLTAKADQDIILRKVKSINDTAIDYSENMELASGALLNVALVSGGLVGFMLDKLLVKIKLGKKNKPLAEYLVDHLLNPLEQKLGDDAIAVKDILKHPKSGARTTILSIMFAVAGGILSIPLTAGLKESASQTGRFIKRKEYMQDDRNYIYFDEDKMAQVKNVKSNDATPGIIRKVYNSLKFLPTAIRQTNEYEKYKKTVRQENKQLSEALKYIELKPGQLEEAKNMQKKILFSLKKVDEKSEEYTQDMRTVSDFVQNSVPYALMGLLVFPIRKKISAINDGKTTFAEMLSSDKKLSTKQKLIGIAGVSAKLLGFYAVEAIMSHAQQVAGKIGVMRAVNELDDPRYFVDKYSRKPEIDKTINNGNTNINYISMKNTLNNWISSLKTTI